MKKKILAVTAAIGIIATTLVAGVYAASDIKLFINGTAIETDLQIVDGSSYVPLRVVSDSIGADVKWDNDKRTITITGKVPALPVDGVYKADNLAFFDVIAKKGQFGWEISTEVRNTGSKTIAGAIFTAVFYGADGKRIGTAQGSVNDLGVSDTKTQRLLTTEDLTGYKTIKFQIDTSY